MTDDEFDYGDDLEESEYNSGPFCRHWSDPSDCGILCVCGHSCSVHGCGNGDGCDREGCDCEKWREEE